MIKHILFFILVGVIAFSQHTAQAENKVISFQGRQIDLEPYLEGFKYKGFLMDGDEPYVFFRIAGSPEYLHYLKIQPGKTWDFSKAQRLLDEDISKRNIWRALHNSWNDKFYLMSDENADEIINAYEIDAKTRTIKKLTQFSYLYDIILSPDKTKLAYAARLNGAEGTDGEIGYVDLKTYEKVTLHRDTPEVRIYFGSLSWSPDSKKIVFTTYINKDRSKLNLSVASLTSPGTAPIITDSKAYRTAITNFKAWSGDKLYYAVREGQFMEVRSYDFKLNKEATVKIDKNINDVFSLKTKNNVNFVVNSGAPYLTELSIHTTIGKTTKTWRYDGSATPLTRSGSEVYLLANGFNSPPTILEFGNKNVKTSFQYSETLQKQTVHCEYEKISYRTFDGFGDSSEKGMLHAYLLKPKKPLPKEKQMVLVEAFYGGKAAYSVNHQIYCQAGLYVLTPSPRGTPGWSSDFVEAFNGDLGGNEILDVFEAAKWVSKKLDIPPERIGAFGHSHGGYATMRLLTFPGEINNHKEDFKWGFGIAGAGISNIIRYYQTGNIPGWVLRVCKEDPSKNPDKWQNRSPDQLTSTAHGPILVIHGSNDSRVPVEESRSFVRNMKQNNKLVTYVEFPGEGHGFQELKNRIEYYRVQMDFMSGLIQ